MVYLNIIFNNINSYAIKHTLHTIEVRKFCLDYIGGYNRSKFVLDMDLVS